MIPQTSWAPAGEMSRFALLHPMLHGVVHALALDRITSSLWFLALVLLAVCSLIAVQIDQWPLVRRLWRVPLGAEQFRHAPYRREFVRHRSRADAARSTFTSRGRLGLLGSPTFHLGLLLVVVAGALRLLFAQTAVVDLIEGETLGPKSGAYGAQHGGLLSRPFQLEQPLVLETLHVARHASGSLSRVSATVSYAGKRRTIRVNAPLALGSELLYLSSMHGPAALGQLRSKTAVERFALMLQQARGPTTYEGKTSFAGGLELRMRANVSGDGSLPQVVEARLLRAGGLMRAGRLTTGRGFSFAPDGRLDLRGMRYWARFRGSRDEFLWLAFAGFALIALGGSLAIGLIRVDSAVIVTPVPEGEHVLVALKPERFAPLYAEQFEALVRAEAGAGEPASDA